MLSDPEKRRNYDMYGNSNFQNNGPSFDYDSFFGKASGHDFNGQFKFTFDNLFEDMPFFKNDPFFNDFDDEEEG